MKPDPSRRGLALVTGASSGIGLEIARQLAARGQPVLGIARRAERLEALAREAQQHGWAPIHPLALDLTSGSAAQAILDRARSLGGARWLVNNAGVGLYGRFADQDGVRLLSMVRLNGEALVALTHAVLHDLLAAGGGVILNVASAAAFQPTPYLAAYGATKAFVLAFSEALAEELRGSGVTVTALAPGPVPTGWQKASLVPEEYARGLGVMTAEECARLAIEAAERGEVVAIPSALVKLAAGGVRLLPRSWVRRAAGRWMKRSGVRGQGSAVRAPDP